LRLKRKVDLTLVNNEKITDTKKHKMTQSPKEYAIELVNKIRGIDSSPKADTTYTHISLLFQQLSIKDAKRIAIITVNEIIIHNYEHLSGEDYYARLNELEEVLKEIQSIK
jgi:hypothetical protein